MIDIVAEKLKETLVESDLNFIGNIAGLVTTLRQEVQVTDSVTKTIKFPATRNTKLADCMGNNSHYSPITPDEAKASVFYFEKLRDLSFKGTTNKTLSVFTGTIRLVGWLNGMKLGKDITGSYVSIKCLEVINQKHVLDSPFTGSFFTITKANPLCGGQYLFSNYSYDESVQFHLYPYDSFAIDIEFKLHVNESCIVPLTPKPVKCLTV